MICRAPKSMADFIEQKISAVRKLASSSKPRTPLSSRAGRSDLYGRGAQTRQGTLPSLAAPPGGGGGAEEGGLTRSWRNDEIEAALKETKMHVGQALLVLQVLLTIREEEASHGGGSGRMQQEQHDVAAADHDDGDDASGGGGETVAQLLREAGDV